MNDDFDDFVFEWAQAARQVAAHLASGDARLKGGLSVDEVADGLRLRQIDAAIEEGAEREFAGFGKARAEASHDRQHAAEHDGAAVTTDLDDIFAGVRVRRGKEG